MFLLHHYPQLAFCVDMLTTIGFTLIAIGVLQCAVNKKAGLYFDGRRSLNSPTRQNLLGVGILSIITGVALFFL